MRYRGELLIRYQRLGSALDSQRRLLEFRRDVSPGLPIAFPQCIQVTIVVEPWQSGRDPLNSVEYAFS